MKSKMLLISLLALLMPTGVTADDLSDGSFPYGLLELRGSPMEMSEEGTFRIYSGSTTFVEGTFSIEGNKMTLFDRGGIYACRGKRMNPGSYYWAVRDQHLSLQMIKDNCGARRTAFVEAPLKIVRPAR
ncbi:MAG: hypothetical protein RQ867_07195 [Mariprofundaceae bacterium]|nr:hypothetical protein [Mariprofundaceae bacterium]